MRSMLLVTTFYLFWALVCSQSTGEKVIESKKKKIEAAGNAHSITIEAMDVNSADSEDIRERFLQVEDQIEKKNNLSATPPLPSLRGAMMGYNYDYYDEGSNAPNTNKYLSKPSIDAPKQPKENTPEDKKPICSNRNCKDIGGSCVKKNKTKDKCEADLCGPRSFLSPCPCDENHCCCMPVTCPAAGSKQATQCEEAGGRCLFKDEKCDGECLPLCGPSCSCCVSGCNWLESACGKFGEGKCKPNCTKDEIVDTTWTKCDGANCKCCSIKQEIPPCAYGHHCGDGDETTDVSEETKGDYGGYPDTSKGDYGGYPDTSKECRDTAPTCHKNVCDIEEKCKKTCGLCGEDENGYPDTSTDENGYPDTSTKCRDTRPGCRKNLCGMKEQCKKTCGLCGRGLPIWKETCENDERVINYMTPKCKCCKQNSCVDAGKHCKNGTGLVKRKCGPDEKIDHHLGLPESLCSCCIVKPCTSPGNKCFGKNGRSGACAANCKFGFESIALCPGPIGQCKCCAPKMCLAVGKVCGNNGICKEKCHEMEKESKSKNAACEGKDCRCCESPVCLDLGKECKNGTGTCRESCDPDTEQAEGACDGKCCYCCVKKKCLNIWEKCQVKTARFGVTHTGICKVKCSEDETKAVTINGQCSGTDCSCCIPTLCVSIGENCGLNDRGRCKEKCNLVTQTVDLTGSCKGIACQCCKNKECEDEGTECLDGKGICRPNCLHDESLSEDLNACKGEDCKCCIPQDCVRMDSACGYGLAGRCKLKCTPSTEDDVGRCDGRKCRCCREKDCRSFGCSCGGKLGGVCKSRCDANEESVSTCEGRNCKCCTEKACDSVGIACGGDLNGQCKPKCLLDDDEVAIGTCPGSDCKCCKKQSCSAKGGRCGAGDSGRCRSKCYASLEETVGLCKGTSLFCCQLKKCSEPGNCCDHMKDNVKISGTCRPECSKDEEMIAPCNGTDCKCCSPKKCDSLGQSCPGVTKERITKGGFSITPNPGICKEKCGPDDEVIGKCLGTSCKCCGHKACTLKGAPCGDKKRGKCVAECRSNEEDIGVCDGANCKCCAIKACVNFGGPCGKNNVGTCRNRCQTTEEPSGRCNGSHCICCEKKVCKDPGQGGCSPQGGTCRVDCPAEDLAPNPYIPNKCGNKCKCCLCQNRDQTRVDTCPRKECGSYGEFGTCKAICSDNEDEIENLNADCKVSDYGEEHKSPSTKSCVCCKTKEYEGLCRPLQRCGGQNGPPSPKYGMCKTKCTQHEQLSRDQSCAKEDGGYGYGSDSPSCVCCVAPKTVGETCPRKSCWSRNKGICKTTCSDYEKEVLSAADDCSTGEEYGGYGDGCKCCILKMEDAYDESSNREKSPYTNHETGRVGSFNDLPFGIQKKEEIPHANHVTDGDESSNDLPFGIQKKEESGVESSNVLPRGKIAAVTTPSTRMGQDQGYTFKTPKPWNHGKRIPEVFLRHPNDVQRGSGGHGSHPTPSPDVQRGSGGHGSHPTPSPDVRINFGVHRSHPIPSPDVQRGSGGHGSHPTPSPDVRTASGGYGHHSSRSPEVRRASGGYEHHSSQSPGVRVEPSVHSPTTDPVSDEYVSDEYDIYTYE